MKVLRFDCLKLRVMSLALRFGPMPEASSCTRSRWVLPGPMDTHVGKNGVCSRFFALTSQDAPQRVKPGFSWGCIAPVQKRGPAARPAFLSYQEALRWVLLFGNLMRNAKGAGSRLPLSISGTNRLGSSIVVADEIHRLTETWMWRKRQSAPGRES